eukprot:2856562-Amphidinium_carterae.2
MTLQCAGCSCGVIQNLCTMRGLPRMYLATRSAAVKRCAQGLDIYLGSFLHAYCKSQRSAARYAILITTDL